MSTKIPPNDSLAHRAKWNKGKFAFFRLRITDQLIDKALVTERVATVKSRRFVKNLFADVTSEYLWIWFEFAFHLLLHHPFS